MVVTALIGQILSLFLMMGLGFLIVKLKLLESRDSKILSILSIYIIMPCVNINAFQISYTPEILRGFLAAVALSVAAHILLLLLSFVLRKVFHMSAVERLSVIYPNAGNLVIPLVSALFGSEWVIYASAYMSVQLFCQWTHGQSAMSGQKSFNFRKIFTNMNLISVVIGLVLFLLRIQLPGVLRSTVSSVASLIGPVSMIMIGMMIAGTSLLGIVKNKRIYLVAFLRLIFVPLLGMLLLKAGGGLVPPENRLTILTIILLPMITPVSATTTQLSQFYNNQPEYCSAINVMTTLFCAVTMPLMIALFGIFVG